MTLTPEQEREIREAFPKARKLLEALCAPHDTPDDADHAWRECRRCLAVEEIGTKTGRLMAQSILAALDEARAERDRLKADVDDCRLYLRTCVDMLRAHGMDGTPWYDGLKRMTKMDAADTKEGA